VVVPQGRAADKLTRGKLNQIQSTTAADIAPYRLYKVSGIAVASIFGSILAGGLLMALNYRMLGRQDLARKAFILTLVATLLVFVIAFQIPPDWHVPDSVFTAPQIALMIYLAKWAQGEDIAIHVRNGGALASNWKAFGISLVVLLVLLAILFLVIAGPQLVPAGPAHAHLSA
jgi:hypothetical protein